MILLMSCSVFVFCNRGPMDCLGQIWRTEGVRGVFRGLGITVMREIPAFGVYFSSYEAMTRTQDSSQPISTMRMMAAGGFAGIFSWLFTYPIDMLKSRLQVMILGTDHFWKGRGIFQTRDLLRKKIKVTFDRTR